MNKITPFLWFDADAEQAADFYMALFEKTRKLSELRIPSPESAEQTQLLTIALEIEGQQVTFMNGGPGHPQTEAFSFVIQCKDQAEIDRYWEKLSEGGSEIACGWVKDRFGVRWQVVPENLTQLLRGPGAMKAMMGMKKLVIAELKESSHS